MKFSVGIPAYNEAENIGQLLEQVLGSEYGRHSLQEVLVYDDASTDATETIVKRHAARDSRIRLLTGATRLGSNAGWNAVFHNAGADAIIKLDADIRVAHDSIKGILDAIASGADVAFGRCEPVAVPGSIAATAIRFSVDVFSRMQKGKFGAYYARGCLIGLRSTVARRLQIPDEIIANDHFTAIEVIKLGCDCRYVDDSKCYFIPPKSFRDYRRQSIRASLGDRQLRGLGLNLDAQRRGLKRAIFWQMLATPLRGLAWVALYVAARLLPRPDYSSSAWAAVASTKSFSDGPER